MAEEEKLKEKKEWMIIGKNLIARRTTKMLIEDALLTRFEDQKTRQEKARKEFFARKAEELLVLRTQQRDIIFEKFHASMHKAKLKDQYATAMQRALRASWHDILGLEFFAEEKRIKMESRITHFNKEESEAAAIEIAAFEHKGFELGAEEPPPPPGGRKGSKKDAKKPPPPAPKKLSKTSIKHAEEPAADPKVEEEKAKAFIKEIKERKEKENAERTELLKKQQEELLNKQEQQRLKDEEEAKKNAEEDAAIQALKDAAEAEEQKKLEEDAKAEFDRRIAQEQELEEKRSEEWDLIRSQEHECFMMHYNDNADEINEEYNKWQEDINAKRKKRWQKHFDFCFDIILQFVSMAECINQYRMEVGKTLPIHEWREWKNLFIKGAILPVVLPRPPPPEEPPTVKEIRLAKEATEEYMDEKGEYASPEGVEPIGKNKELGQLLVDLVELSDSLAEPFVRPDLTKFTLMLSVVGSPYAGKTTLAKHLELEYGILRIDIEQVQTLAVTFGTEEEERIKAEQVAQPPPPSSLELKEAFDAKDEGKGNNIPVDILAKLSPKARLGLQAKSAVEKKELVPDDVIAELLLLTMLHPEEYVAPVRASPAPSGKGGKIAAKAPPPQAKKPSVKGKGAPPAALSSKQSGFVLDGFPQTRGQAAALEKFLTGLDFEAQKANVAKASKIAPPPEPDIVKPVKSGLDAYFIVEKTPEEELVRALMMSVVDPDSGIAYHPQNNPVPAGDKTGIVECLQPVTSVEAIRAKIAAGVETFVLLHEILSRFSNVHYMPQQSDQIGNSSPEVIIATKVIADLLDTKAKQAARDGADNVAIEAVVVAKQASKEVDTTSKAAEELARIFYHKKLEEVEEEQASLSNVAAAPPDPKTAKAKPPPPKEKPSDAIAKQLDEITKVVREAQEAAVAASAAAKLAQKHAQDAQAAQVGNLYIILSDALNWRLLSPEREKSYVQVDDAQIQMGEGGPEVASLCKEEAVKATDTAKEAATKAAEASQKATALLQSAKDIAEGKLVTPPKGDKAKGGKEPAPIGKPAAKGGKEPLIAETDTALEPPPPIVKPPPDPKFLERAKTAELLHKRWQELEENYLQTLQEGFRLLIREREQTIPLLIQTKWNFAELLKQLNGKQELFEDFQERFNRIEQTQRRNREMQKRLNEEGSNFAEILRTLCREHLKIGKETEQRTLEDLLDERTATFTSLFTLLVQAELDRHVESCGILHELFSNSVGSNFAKQFRCSLTTSRRQPTWRFVRPKWLSPLEGSFPEFYVVLCEALAKSCNLLDMVAGRVGGGMKLQPRRRRSRRMSGRWSTWMRVMDPTYREEVPLDLDVEPSISREHQIFYYRLELLARTACKYLEELQPVCDGAYGLMDHWLMRRCNAESDLVEEVISVIEDAVREGIPLWYRVWMELDSFRVEEEDITRIVHVPPEPIVDLTPWHILVMESLVKTFKSFQGGFATTQKVIEAALTAIDAVYMMWRTHPDHTFYPRLPRYKSRRYGHFQHWANLAYEIIEQSTGEKEPGYISVIEWRGFLVCLVDAHFDYPISGATISDIVQARTDMFLVIATKQPGDSTQGYITLDDLLSTNLWFDTADVSNEGFREEEDDSEPESEEEAWNNYDFPASLKTFIYSVLEKGNGLPWQTLLLYLCRDASHETALRKAFTVLASTMSPDEAELSPTELIQALYPSGIDGALEAGCIPWTTDDMKDIMFRAHIEKATPNVEPRTVPSNVSSDSEILPTEKDTVSLFLADHSSSHVSEVSQSVAETIQEFMSNIPDSVASTITVVTPWQESEEELEFSPQAPIQERLTVDDCLKLNATAKLCGALSASFRQHSVHVMSIAPEKAVR